jgi:hypothetical protein
MGKETGRQPANETEVAVKMQSIEDYVNRVIVYLEDDLKSFEFVINSNGSQCPGKLAIGLVTTAMAAFDAFAFILYPRLEFGTNKEKQMFNALLNDRRFFDKSRVHPDKGETIFYSVIRCGVVHQLFPKGASLVALQSPEMFYGFEGRMAVNAYAVFKFVLDGIKRIKEHVDGLGPEERNRLALKLLVRATIDEEEMQGQGIDVAELPPLPVSFQRPG